MFNEALINNIINYFNMQKYIVLYVYKYKNIM